MRTYYGIPKGCSRTGQSLLFGAFIVFISVAALTGCSDGGTEQVPGRDIPEEGGLKKTVLRSPFRTTDKGLFRILLSIKEPGAMVGANRADITL